MKWSRILLMSLVVAILLMSLVVALALAGLMLPTPKVNADFGTNWTGVFFNDPSLTGSQQQTVSVPSGLNFRWEEGAPIIKLIVWLCRSPAAPVHRRTVCNAATASPPASPRPRC